MNKMTMGYNDCVLHFTRTVKRGVEKYLQFLVQKKLARTRPTIIGVTGSIGKTSTKEAIYHVLKTKWRTYRNPKSLNTEIGLLLAILEQPSGFRSPFKWAAILARAAVNAFRSKKYDFMVLEYGADKPGDIEHLVSIVKPHIGVITQITRVHQAAGQFKTLEEVFQEKQKLVTCLDESGIAILNHSNALLKKLDGKLRAPIHWFNLDDGIYADDLTSLKTGFSATIHMKGKSVKGKFSIPGTYHIDVFLPALLIGTLQGIPLEQGVRELEQFTLPPGRMSIIPGIHNSTLLDSTYNASPKAVIEALKLLKEFPGKRKIAVLGNMNELGEYTRQGHEEVGEHISEWLDLLITVGGNAHVIATQALKNGFPKARIETLLDAQAAGEFLKRWGLREGDTVLLKGSQNRVRLERATKLLMKHPADAKHLLCRQETEWESI